MQDRHTPVFRGELVGEISGAVGRAVIDDQDVVPVFEDRSGDVGEVLQLVVGR
jgi:hypothetical protein